MHRAGDLAGFSNRSASSSRVRAHAFFTEIKLKESTRKQVLDLRLSTQRHIYTMYYHHSQQGGNLFIDVRDSLFFCIYIKTSHIEYGGLE